MHLRILVVRIFPAKGHLHADTNRCNLRTSQHLWDTAHHDRGGQTRPAMEMSSIERTSFQQILEWNVGGNWVFRHDNVFSLISVQVRCQTRKSGPLEHRTASWTALTALDEAGIVDGPPQFANLRLVLLVGTAVVGATTSTCLAPNSPGVAGTLDTTSWFLVSVAHLHLRGLKTCGVMPCPPRTTLNCLSILDKILFRLL